MADELTPRQHKAISALLLAPTLKAAAEQAGCAERTLRGWLSEPAFAAALAAAEGQAIDAATRRLIALQDSAVDALEQVLADAKTSAAVRVRASAVVLEYLLKLRELRNMEQRLSRLEEIYAKQAY
jgi:gamma-glutamyl:cysteine ligase YbdK (ATP-grasp superfamily)